MNHDLHENALRDLNSLILHTSCVGWVVQIVQVLS